MHPSYVASAYGTDSMQDDNLLPSYVLISLGIQMIVIAPVICSSRSTCFTSFNVSALNLDREKAAVCVSLLCRRLLFGLRMIFIVIIDCGQHYR